jgi:predicted dehydrogenase
MPLARLEREMVLGGELGTVCNALFTCCSSAGLEQSAGDWRALPGKNPGGPLLQCGIHTLDQMLGTFGHAKRVCAMMQNSVTPHDVVDNTMTLFEFASGHQATFVCNYTTAYMHTHSYFGTRANLHVHSHITGLGQSQIYLQERARGPHELWRMLRIPDAGGYPDPHGGVLERDFARQIREGAPDYANARDAAAALAVLEAAVESHETGRAVEVAAV